MDQGRFPARAVADDDALDDLGGGGRAAAGGRLGVAALFLGGVFLFVVAHDGGVERAAVVKQWRKLNR